MTVKYTRRTATEQAGHPPNRYEVQRRLGPSNPRHRLLVIYIGIGLVSIILLLYHLLSKDRTRQWLPERRGEAVVVDKDTIDSADGGETRYLLQLRLAVPAASAPEAAYVPEGTANRESIVGPRAFTEVVETTADDWASVDVGTRLGASYQITASRDRIRIRSLDLAVGEPLDERGDGTPTQGEK